MKTTSSIDPFPIRPFNVMVLKYFIPLIFIVEYQQIFQVLPTHSGTIQHKCNGTFAYTSRPPFRDIVDHAPFQPHVKNPQEMASMKK